MILSWLHKVRRRMDEEDTQGHLVHFSRPSLHLVGDSSDDAKKLSLKLIILLINRILIAVITNYAWRKFSSALQINENSTQNCASPITWQNGTLMASFTGYLLIAFELFTAQSNEIRLIFSSKIIIRTQFKIDSLEQLLYYS